jgi:hypothetical protein
MPIPPGDVPRVAYCRENQKTCALPFLPGFERHGEMMRAHRQMSMPKRVRARTWRPPLPRPAGGPDAAEAARRVAQAGRAAIRRQHPSSLRARRGRSLPWCGELTFRTPTRHRAPNQQPGRILIPGDGAAGDQELRIGLSARRWRLRGACGLSRLNDFLALWSQVYVSSCNRQVTSTSMRTSGRIRSADWPLLLGVGIILSGGVTAGLLRGRGIARRRPRRRPARASPEPGRRLPPRPALP